ncbi:Paired amphipathic helix protein Sin3-like 4, partial [Linum grandiflorum]
CEAVRARFVERPEKYVEFIRILRYHHAGRLDAATVAAKVHWLLRGHLDLISGFNNTTFLPDGYQIDTNAQPQRPEDEPLDIGRRSAKEFLNNLKTRFRGDSQILFITFVAILIIFETETDSYTQLFLEVAELFKAHQDILCQFVEFFYVQG